MNIDINFVKKMLDSPGRLMTNLLVDDKTRQVISGDDAVWIDMGDHGYKFISSDASKNIERITSLDGYQKVFPEVYETGTEDGVFFIKCESVKGEKSTTADKTRCVRFFIDNCILPEDEWCKDINFIGGKVVDFHRFRINKDRYYFPCFDTEKIASIHENALQRYADMGINKWKGKIYQGMNFFDGSSRYTMNGYSSDGQYFDSFIKLQFSYLNKVKGKDVLDIGCNEGFMCQQAQVHGAKSVTGVELLYEDIQFAKEIDEQTLMGETRVNFVQGDAKEFVMEDQNTYENVYLFSVLHQLYDNMVGSYDFLNKLSNMCNRVIFETPVNHPKMNIPESNIVSNLQKHFPTVRKLYEYNAYSTGERVIYALYT